MSEHYFIVSIVQCWLPTNYVDALKPNEEVDYKADGYQWWDVYVGGQAWVCSCCQEGGTDWHPQTTLSRCCEYNCHFYFFLSALNILLCCIFSSWSETLSKCFSTYTVLVFISFAIPYNDTQQTDSGLLLSINATGFGLWPYQPTFLKPFHWAGKPFKNYWAHF